MLRLFKRVELASGEDDELSRRNAEPGADEPAAVRGGISPWWWVGLAALGLAAIWGAALLR